MVVTIPTVEDPPARSMTNGIDDEMSRLSSLSIEELKSIVAKIIERPVTFAARREFLIRIAAYSVQEREFGGLSPTAKRTLHTLAVSGCPPAHGAATDSRPVQKRAVRRSFKPGTRFIREWHGASHDVLILENGFRYRGKQYASLSVIARKITGTRWSGPAFFGLNKRATQAEPPNE
jgi:DUF2924 family protein